MQHYISPARTCCLVPGGLAGHPFKLCTLLPASSSLIYALVYFYLQSTTLQYQISHWLCWFGNPRSFL